MSAPDAPSFAQTHPVLDALLHPGGGLVTVAVVAVILIWAYATLRFNAKTERNKRIDALYEDQLKSAESPISKAFAAFGQQVAGVGSSIQGARPTLVTEDEIAPDRPDFIAQMSRDRADRASGRKARPARDNPQA